MIETMKSALLSALKPFNFAIWGILIAILTVAGPFGTYESVTFEWRFVYWSSVVIVSSILGYQAAYVSRAITRRSHPVMTDAVTTLLMVATFAPFNHFLTQAVVVPTPGEGPTFIEMVVYVASISFGILTGRRFIPGLEERNYVSPDHDSNQPRLMRRLSPATQGAVLRISSQDHFVDITTERGTDRLRMRLADAVAEMDGVRGHLIHRSHWVAETAIRSVEREQGRIQLRLTNGDTVPVSRTYKAELENAGVL